MVSFPDAIRLGFQHYFDLGIECCQYQDRHIVRPRCANPRTGIGY